MASHIHLRQRQQADVYDHMIEGIAEKIMAMPKEKRQQAIRATEMILEMSAESSDGLGIKDPQNTPAKRAEIIQMLRDRIQELEAAEQG